MARVQLAAGILAIIGLPGPAYTQDAPTGTAAGRALAQAPSNLPFAGTFGATGATGARTSSQVVLEATANEKTGTASLSRKIGSLHFGLNLTGALADGEARPLVLDGLSSGARAAFHFSRWNWAGPHTAEQRQFNDMCRTAATACACLPEDFPNPADQATARMLSATTPPTLAALEEYGNICLAWTGRRDCSLADLLDPPTHLASQNLLTGTPPSAAAVKALDALCRTKANTCWCSASDIKDPALHAKALHLLRADRRPTFIAGGVEVGRTRFKYLDPTTLAAAAENHNDWVVNVRAGVFVAPYGFLVASYSYSKTFSAAAAPRDICMPLAGTTSPEVTSCRNAVLGAPTSDSGSIIGIELRRISAGGLGFAPSVQRHLGQKVTAVQLPLYFIAGKDSSIIGGVRVGWRSDEKTPTVAVFVGSAFTLVP